MIGIDTNILIYAHDAMSPYHEDALTFEETFRYAAEKKIKRYDGK